MCIYQTYTVDCVDTVTSSQSEMLPMLGGKKTT